MSKLISEVSDIKCNLKIGKLLRKIGWNVPGFLEDVLIGYDYKNYSKTPVPKYGLGAGTVLPTYSLINEWIAINFDIWMYIYPSYALNYIGVIKTIKDGKFIHKTVLLKTLSKEEMYNILIKIVLKTIEETHISTELIKT